MTQNNEKIDNRDILEAFQALKTAKKEDVKKLVDKLIQLGQNNEKIRPSRCKTGKGAV